MEDVWRYSRYMTTTSAGPVHLTFEERFTIALMRAHMSKRDFAEHVGTTAKTVWTWETLRVRPAVSALRVLAAESGFEYEWLRPSPEELEEGRSQYTPRDLNPEPTDVFLALVFVLIFGAIQSLSPQGCTATRTLEVAR